MGVIFFYSAEISARAEVAAVGGSGQSLIHCHPRKRMERYRGAKTPSDSRGVPFLLFALLS